MAYGKIKADTFVYDNSGSDVEVTLSSLGNKANLASPTFTGTVTIPTPAANDNTTKAASTAYVQTELGDYALKASPTFTGTVNAAALTLSGDLQVNGTTTTVASSTMTVTDKNIEIAKGAANDAAADGAGITVDSGDGDKTWNWVNATDAWTSSEHIQLSTGKNLTLVSGALGIGDTTPNFEIHVKGADAAPQLRLESSDGSGAKRVDLFLDGGKAIFGANQSAQTIAFQTGYTDRLTIANDGSVTAAGTVSDSKGDLRKIVQNERSAAYTLVAADAGKHVSTNNNVTIPQDVFSAGDAITIYSYSSGDISIISNSNVTVYFANDGTNADRTLATRGLATILCVATNTFVISGAGLS